MDTHRKRRSKRPREETTSEVSGVWIDPNCAVYRCSTIDPQTAQRTLGKHFEFTCGTNRNWPIVTYRSAAYLAFTSEPPGNVHAIPFTDIQYFVLAQFGLPFRLLYGPTIVVGLTPEGDPRSLLPAELSWADEAYHRFGQQLGPPQGLYARYPGAAIIRPHTGIYGILKVTPETLQSQVLALMGQCSDNPALTVLTSDQYHGYTVKSGPNPVPADDIAHYILDRLGFAPRTLYGPVVVLGGESPPGGESLCEASFTGLRPEGESLCEASFTGLLPHDLDLLNSLYSSRS